MSLLNGTDTSGAAGLNLTTSSNTSSSTNNNANTTSNALTKVPDKRNIDISVEDKHRVFLHPSSVNFDNFTFKESNFVMYGERQLVTYTNNNTGNTESKIYLRDTTEASAFALLFFGGVLEVEYSDGIVTVDGWIRCVYDVVCNVHFALHVENILQGSNSCPFLFHICMSFPYPHIFSTSCFLPFSLTDLPHRGA